MSSLSTQLLATHARVARSARRRASYYCMVLPLLELVPELQALFVALLVDATTAGRLAQASRACKELLGQRLVVLREEHRLAAQAQMEEQRQRKRAAVLELFDTVDGGAFYSCKAHTVGIYPCGRRLRVARSGSVRQLRAGQMVA